MNTGAEAVETAIKVAPQVGLPGQGRAGRAGRRSSWRRTTSTAGPPRSSASPPTRTRATTSARTRRASGSCRTATLAALAEAIDAEHRRGAARADPGRGRACWCRRPATSPRSRAALRRAQRAADRRRDPVRARAAPGETFACEHEGVVPDMYVLGKALGGGIVPVSAVAANRDVLGVLQPGEHGSTFGGNPLACAVGIEVVAAAAAPASSSSGPRELGERAARAAGRAGRQGRCWRCAGAGCGPASTSTRR